MVGRYIPLIRTQRQTAQNDSALARAVIMANGRFVTPRFRRCIALTQLLDSASAKASATNVNSAGTPVIPVLSTSSGGREDKRSSSDRRKGK